METIGQAAHRRTGEVLEMDRLVTLEDLERAVLASNRNIFRVKCAAHVDRYGRPAEGIGVDGTVSVRNYLKCELYTYSVKTLALFILSIEHNPEYNRYLATMQKMVQAYGYSSLEEAEKAMA